MSPWYDGFGRSERGDGPFRECANLDTVDAAPPSAGPSAWTMPFDGQAGVPPKVYTGGEWPHPPQYYAGLPSTLETGPQIIVQTNVFARCPELESDSFTLTGPQGPVDLVVVRGGTVGPDGRAIRASDAIRFVIPRTALEPSSTYRLHAEIVRHAGTCPPDGSGITWASTDGAVTKDMAFATAAAAAPPPPPPPTPPPTPTPPPATPPSGGSTPVTGTGTVVPPPKRRIVLKALHATRRARSIVACGTVVGVRSGTRVAVRAGRSSRRTKTKRNGGFCVSLPEASVRNGRLKARFVVAGVTRSATVRVARQRRT